MSKELFLQLHVHSNRSHDSSTPISEYVSYLNNLTIDFDCAVLGITDHNIVPISMKRALEYSTKQVIVIPGMQWRIRQNMSERLSKRSTRREILTLGNHDDLCSYITDKTQYRISDDEEILGHFKEQELLSYMSHNSDLALVVPHPKHFIVDYYGPNEIKVLNKKMESQGIAASFFVEVKTGCDPFPRIFSAYDGEYCVLGGSDAHEIKGLFGTESMLSVKTTIPVKSTLLESLEKTVEQRELASFEHLVKDILSTLKRDNKQITIEKHYGRSTAQLIGIVPRWLRRRLDSFPRNLFK
jgi:hypothetical protein